MSSNVKVVDNLPDLLKRIKTLTKSDVLVGIPSTAGNEPGSQISLASIGYIQEHGSPVKNIPARPFLTPGVADARDAIVRAMKKGAQAALKGDVDGLAAAFDVAGGGAVVAVKARITGNIPPPLSQRTLAERKRRGVSRTNTLVDTGNLLNSVIYVVRRK